MCHPPTKWELIITFKHFSEYQILKPTKRAGAHSPLQFFETQLVLENFLSFQVDLESMLMWNCTF